MLLLTFSLLLAGPLPQAQEEPASTSRPTVYRVDRIETLDGEAITNGTVIVRDGVIEKIGKAVVLPERAKVEDLRGGGSTLMPPLVLSHARHLQRDRRSRGRNGRYRAVDSLYLEEDDLSDLRELGILLLGLDPPGQGIPGRTSVLATDGEGERPDALVRDLHLSLTIDANANAKDLLRKALKDADKAIEDEAKAREEWKKKREEWEAKQKAQQEEEKKSEKGGGDEGDGAEGRPGPKGGRGGGGGNGNGKSEGKNQDDEEKEPPKEFEPPAIDPDLLPVVEWVRRERLAQIWLNSAAEWLHWHDVLGERDLPYEAVLTHGTSNSFSHIAEELAESGVRVYCPARLSFLPSTRIRYNLPAELARAGAEFVLEPATSGFSAVEDLRMSVAEIVREGLDRRAALEAVTIRPAAALGQEEIVQPLVAGAPATFVIFDGDVLDPTARAVLLVRDGKVLFDRAREEASR